MEADGEVEEVRSGKGWRDRMRDGMKRRRDR